MVDEARGSDHFARSTRWSGIGKYGYTVCNVAFAMVLARMLSPRDFGVVGLATASILFLNLFGATAIATVIINNHSFDRRALRTMMSMACTLGAGLAVSMFLLSGYLTKIFNLAGAGRVFRWMSPCIFFLCASQVALGVLIREMRFKRIALVDICSAVAGGGTGLGMACCEYGLWSLVGQHMVSLGVRCVLSFACANMLPIPGWDMSIVRKAIPFAWRATLNGLVEYVPRSVDQYTVGGTCGMLQLGYYNRATYMMWLPLNMIIAVIFPVLQGELAGYDGDVHKTRDRYLQVVTAVALLTFPTMGVVMIWAKEIILLLWGSQWEPAVLPFRYLAASGMIYPVLAISSSVFYALIRLKQLVVYSSLLTAANCIGILVGSKWGMTGVAAGYAVSFFVMVIPLMLYLICVILAGRPADLFYALRGPVLTCMIVCLVAGIVRYWLPVVLFSGVFALPLMVVVVIPVYLTAAERYSAEGVCLIRQVVPLIDRLLIAWAKCFAMFYRK